MYFIKYDLCFELLLFLRSFSIVRVYLILSQHIDCKHLNINGIKICKLQLSFSGSPSPQQFLKCYIAGFRQRSLPILHHTDIFSYRYSFRTFLHVPVTSFTSPFLPHPCGGCLPLCPTAASLWRYNHYWRRG